MGNLLGSPVVDKETHVGSTEDYDFGLSSMQGWRVHMEDAHIAEANLYATIRVADNPTFFKQKKKRLAALGLKIPNNSSSKSTNSQSQEEIHIDLPGHSFFGVFDGHGGTFAAQYTGDNLCRVLSKQSLFCEYAIFYREAMMMDAQSKFASPHERSMHLRSGMEYLEGALKQAFVELDAEIAMAISGTPHPDANTPYQRPGTEGSVSAQHALPADEKARPDGSVTNVIVDPTAATDNNNDNGHNQEQNIPQEEQQQQQQDDQDAIMEQQAQQVAANQARALADHGDSGTTACAVLITPDWLVCANAGDARAVFAKNDRAIPLSYDHKPDDEEEERRVRSAGGYVAGGRVEGDLAVSRGLGDFRFKHIPTALSNTNLLTGKPQRGTHADAVPNSNTNNGVSEQIIDAEKLMKPGDQKVSPVPDIIMQSRSVKDQFVIIACDGIWDVQENQDCVDTVASIFNEGENDIGLLCEEVLDTCLKLGSKDNMTALVVKFKAQKVGKGGGVQARRLEREVSEGKADDDEANSQVIDEDSQGDDNDDAPSDEDDLPEPIPL